jgi:hypothetical protein
MPRQTPAYTPRWLYRIFAFIQRLPVRGWALALLVALLGGLGMAQRFFGSALGF